MVNFKNKAGFLLVVLAALIYCLIEAENDGDFYIFMSAAGDLLRHKNIFVTKYINSDYHYYYSVFFAILLSPFYYVSFYWVKFGWLLLNVAMYLHLFWLLAQSSLLKPLSLKQKNWFFFFVFVFSLRFLRDNIHLLQITILLLWCSVYGLYLIHRNKPLAGTFILALGINIKLLPLVLVPYLIYRANYKAVFYTLFFLAVLLFFPSVLIGHDFNMTLLESWFNLLNPTNQQHVLDVDERSFHSLTTLLSVLLVEKVPDMYAMDIKRNIMDVSYNTLANVILVTRLTLISFTFYFLKWRPFAKVGSNNQLMIELSYILLLIPLIFPHQQHYAFLFIVPAFAITLCYLLLQYHAMPKKQKWILVSVLSIIYLTANLKIVLGEFNKYYEHFKILTYGALLFIPLLVWVEKKRGSESC